MNGGGGDSVGGGLRDFLGGGGGDSVGGGGGNSVDERHGDISGRICSCEVGVGFLNGEEGACCAKGGVDSGDGKGSV